MQKVGKFFLTFILTFALVIPVSLQWSEVAFAAVQCTSTSNDCKLTGKTDAFGSEGKKYKYSKEWKSTGAQIELTITETTRKKDLFEKINAKLQKKKSNGDWEEVTKISNMTLDNTKSFSQKIEPNVTYRVAFYHSRTLNVTNKVSYKIEQKQPQNQKKSNGKWDYFIEPEFDFSNKKINYEVLKNGEKEKATGNISYQTFSSPTSYTPLSSGVSYNASAVVMRPSSTLVPAKLHYAGELNPQRKGHKVSAKFIGHISGQSKIFRASSYLDVYYHTTGNLKMEKDVKSNGDVKLTISTPKHYPKPTGTASVKGPEWKVTIKQDKKVVTSSNKIDFNGKSISYTIKKSKIDPSKRITVDMDLKAYDLKIKPGSPSQQSDTYKVMNIYEANAIKSFKLEQEDNSGNDENGGNGDNGGNEDDNSNDDNQQEQENKDAKIDISSKILADDKVEIKASLSKVDQPKGKWKLTFNGGDEKTAENKDTITETFSTKNIDKEKVKVIAKFTGEDKKGKINLTKEKEVKIKEETENPPAENTDAKILITPTILDNDQVEIKAELEKAEELKPTGTWTLIFNENKDDAKTSNEASITETFSTKELTETEVPVTAKFVGKDKDGKTIEQEVTEQVTVKNETNSEQTGDQGGTTSDEDENVVEDNEDNVEDEVLVSPQAPSGQVGGKLPKTATNYSSGLIAGILLFLGSASVLYWRRRA